MQMEISKEFHFEASHILPKHPGKCARLHGHSWVLKVYVKGEVAHETGFVMDYADITTVVQRQIIHELDHRHLGTFSWQEPTGLDLSPGDIVQIPVNWRASLPSNFYPTSENLLMWIGSVLIGVAEFPWTKLELNETCTSSCILTREDYETAIRNR